ncbi:MAG: Leucine-rich repeat (LRR) protein, partial [Phenylobacterium sp.]
ASNVYSGSWSSTGHSSVTLGVDTTSISEASGISTVTATMSNVSFEDVTVALGYSGTATSGADYKTPAAAIVITAGQLQGSTTLESIQDTSVETTETVIVDITSITGGSVTENGTQQQTVAIADDDVTNVSLSVNNAVVSESGGSSTITATLDKTTYEDVTVNFAFTGSATTTDFSLNAGSITIAAGHLVASMTLSVNPDTLVEGDETVIIDISGVSGGNANENGIQQQTLTIIDDDFNAVVVSLAVSPASLGEYNAVSTVTATLDSVTTADVTVNLAYSGTATNGTDYTASSNTLVIAAGQTTGQTTLTSINDPDIEDDETIIIDINSVTGANASENGTQRQTVTIVNDDFSQVFVSLSANVGSVTEDAGVSIIAATLDSATVEDVFVNLSYSGTAINGADYSAQSRVILITAGKTRGTTTVTASQDSVIEGVETITIDIESITGPNVSELGGMQLQTVTIADDDFEPVLVSLAISTDTMAEAGGISTVTATLDNVTIADVVVQLGFSGTATYELDDEIVGNFTTDFTPLSTVIVIAAGEKSATTILTANQDAEVEGPQTIIIDIATVKGAGASEDGTQQRTVTIADDDFNSVLVSLQASPDILTEAGGFSTIIASLDSATFEDVTVGLTFAGTATNGTDYTIVAETITIIAGQTLGTTIIAAKQDLAIEGLETLVVDIDSISGGNAAENGFQRSSLTILDDDISQVSLNVDTAAIWEVAGAAVISAQLDKVSYEDVVVSLVYSGTAANGSDYNASSELTIKSGETTGIINLTAIVDTVVEDAESIIIDVAVVSGGNAYEGGTQQATVTLFEGEVDTDFDGIGNTADLDDDNDGIPDTLDAFPLDSTEIADTDGDGIGNNADTDDDNDGVLDAADDFPLDSNQTRFTLIAQLTIADEFLATCIADTAATHNWTQISEVVSLDCSGKGIRDLASIERFTALKSLILNNNALTDIELLASLSQLSQLDLSQNKLVDSTALSSLTALTELDLASNTIDNVIAVSQLSQLTSLSLGNNLIVDIEPLGNITSLNEIDLNNNRIGQVSGLFNLTQTAKIDLLENNNIDCVELDNLVGALTDSDITRPKHCHGSGIAITEVPFANDDLRQCVLEAATQNDWYTVGEVTQLSCAGQAIDDLTGLDYFIHLTALTLNNNQLSDLAPLSSLIELTKLDLRQNKVADISGLNRLTALTTLKLSKNQLENIAVVANFSQLTTLTLANNQLTDSQLDALVELEHLSALYLRDNLITDITALKPLNKLKRLYLSGNDISDISLLAGFNQLIKLELEDNNISDISALFDLNLATSIKLVGNDDIACVDINALESSLHQATIVRPSSCINIGQIHFSDSALASCVVEAALDNGWITANQVEGLSCEGQTVKTLNGIEKLTALTSLALDNNQIVAIKPLRRLSHLTTLSLRHNQFADISALFELSKANTIDLFGNDGIDCVSLDVLASAVEGRVLTRPEACVN